MKKVFLLFAALFMATVANAQFDICIGPKLGYQTTKLSVKKDNIKSDFKGNMTFGVFGRVTVKKFVVQPELLYFKSGKVLQLDVMGDDWGLGNLVPNPTLTINQANLALPIFLGYQFLDLDLIKMRANVGPVFYFALGEAEYVVEGQDKPLEGLGDATKKSTLGGALNLGVDVWKLTLDINYSFGLSKVFNDEFKVRNVSIPVADDTKQNIFTVTLGFKFL